MKLIHNIFLVIVGCSVSASSFLAQYKNELSFQLGIINYFFDKEPLFNEKCMEYSMDPLPINLIFHDSGGINFTRKIGEKSNFYAEYDFLKTEYTQNGCLFFDHPVINFRRYYRYNLGYTKILQAKESKFSFQLGGGITLLTGRESIVMVRIPLGFTGSGIYELLLEDAQRKDIGFQALIGMRHQFSKRFFWGAKIDFTHLVFLYDKEKKDFFREFYNTNKFPARSDLCFKLTFGTTF